MSEYASPFESTADTFIYKEEFSYYVGLKLIRTINK